MISSFTNRVFVVVLFGILLLNDQFTGISAKKGGGGGAGRGAKTGSFGRGSSSSNVGSSSRTGIGAASGNRGTSSNIGGGAYSGSYANKKPSSGGGSWKTHAAAGVAGAVIGGAISHQLTKSYYRQTYGGRDYYYGDRYYRPTQSYMKKCSYTLDSNDYMKYDDGYQVKEIVFECNSRSEHCCGMECCSNSAGGLPWWGILLAIVAAICLIATCVYLVMKYRRPANQFANASAAEASVPLQANTNDMNSAKAYTAQPGGVYYPPSGSYPAYPPTNNPAAAQWQQPPPYPAQSYAYPQQAPYPTKQY